MMKVEKPKGKKGKEKNVCQQNALGTRKMGHFSEGDTHRAGFPYTHHLGCRWFGRRTLPGHPVACDLVIHPTLLGPVLKEAAKKKRFLFSLTLGLNYDIPSSTL